MKFFKILAFFLVGTLAGQLAPLCQAKEKKAAKASPEKKETKKKLVGYAKVRRIVSRLEAIKRGLLESGQSQSWLIEGQIRVIHYSPNYWERAKEFVEAYRKLIALVVKIPVGAFLTHPRGFVKIAELIKWGQQVAIGRHKLIQPGFTEVIPVLEAKLKDAPKVDKKTKKTKSDKKS